MQRSRQRKLERMAARIIAAAERHQESDPRDSLGFSSSKAELESGVAQDHQARVVGGKHYQTIDREEGTMGPRGGELEVKEERGSRVWRWSGKLTFLPKKA